MGKEDKKIGHKSNKAKKHHNTSIIVDAVTFQPDQNTGNPLTALGRPPSEPLWDLVFPLLDVESDWFLSLTGGKNPCDPLPV